MCYRPIYIYNPVRTYNFDQPIKIAVPCGCCEDCQRTKTNEWFFRSYVEYKHYKKIGGSVYFVTLTYDNDHLPWLEFKDGKKIPCFNKFHIRNFIKYIRVWLKRNHMLSTGIKYLICSEYGKTTKRPHYHGLLFFPFHIPPMSFTRLMRTWWQHGFVICSKQGWEIKSLAGITYASKYVAKDFSYFELPELKDVVASGELSAFKKEYSDSMPRHWQSVGFGSPFLNTIQSQDDIPQFLKNNSYRLYNDDKGVYPIPRYYHLKLEKFINKEYSKLLDKVVLERTEIGTKVKELRLSESVSKDMLNLQVLTSDYISRHLQGELSFRSRIDALRVLVPQQCMHFDKILNVVLGSYINFSDMSHKLSCEIPALLRELGIYRVSTYRVFLRYMPLLEEEDPEHKFQEIEDIKHCMLYPPVYPPEYEEIIVPSGLSEFAHPTDAPEVRHVSLCCHHRYFQRFETLCRYIDDFNVLVSIHKEFDTLYKKYRKALCKYYQGDIPTIYSSFKS